MRKQKKVVKEKKVVDYTVMFVGLTFFKDEGKRGMRVLLPDGSRAKQFGIDPHYASIAAAQDSVLSVSGWKGEEIETEHSKIEFYFPQGKVSLGGADTPGKIDAARQMKVLPKLKKINRKFNLDPAGTNAVADMTICQGEFGIYRMPGTPDDGTGALVSLLKVPHAQDFTVTVTPRDGSENRTIEFKAGSEIAFVNTSRHAVPTESYDRHFEIYGELSLVHVKLTPRKTPLRTPLLPTRNPTFFAPEPMLTGPGCSNAG
jgi:hypothetical protein